MNLKTFRRNSMAQALAEVKKGLGQDAVILHTRTYRVGALFGLGGRNIVEITASDQAAAREAKRQARRPVNPYGTTIAPAGSAHADIAKPTEPARGQAPMPRAASDHSPQTLRRAETASSKDGFTPSTFETVRTTQEAVKSVMPQVGRTSQIATPVTTSDAASVSPIAAAGSAGSVGTVSGVNAANAPDKPLQSAAHPETSMASPAVILEATKAPQSPISRLASSRLTGSPARLAPVDDLALATLQDELSSIKRLVGQVLQCSRQTASTLVPSETETRAGSKTPGANRPAGVLNLGGMSDPLFASYMALTESGVAPELAEDLVGKARDELTPADLADELVVGPCLLRHISDSLRVVGSLPRLGRQADGRPLVLALVGPTGVGKTTTIAKLAATFKLRHSRKVGLVTADTYRIAAVEQLRTYAEIIGLPLKVVNSPAEVASAVESLHDCDVVLLDTAGRSQNDKNRLTELSEVVSAASPHEIHLVLSSTVAEGVMKRTVDRFSALKPSRLIFTKLDEAVAFGSIFNVAVGTKLPVSFVTTGQEVPDQFELADASRLARLVLQAAGRTVGGEAALSESGA